MKINKKNFILMWAGLIALLVSLDANAPFYWVIIDALIVLTNGYLAFENETN